MNSKLSRRREAGSGKRKREAGQVRSGKREAGSGTGSILLSQATFLLAHIAKKREAGQEAGSGTGPILLSQATFLLAHIANSGPVPLSPSRFPRSPLSALQCLDHIRQDDATLRTAAL